MLSGKFIHIRDVPSDVLTIIASSRRGEDISPLLNWGLETGFLVKTGRLISLNLLCDMCHQPAIKQLYVVRKALNQGSKDNYCSKKCCQSHHSFKNSTKLCEVCSKPALNRHARYCSEGCKRQGRFQRRKKRECPHCGAQFVGWTMYCEPACAGAVHSNRMLGAKNSRFQELGKYSNQFRRMSPIIKERDNFKCSACEILDQKIPHGKHKKRSILCIHHIDEDTKNNRPENLITLCFSCHKKHHQGSLMISSSLPKMARERSRSMTYKLKTTTTSLLAIFSPTIASS